MQMIRNLFLFIMAGLLSGISFANGVQPWKVAHYEVLSADSARFQTTRYNNPFSGSNRSILEAAAELSRLEGVKLPVDRKGSMKPYALKVRFKEAAQLLIGTASAHMGSADVIRQVSFPGGSISVNAVLKNAISVTELPCMDVYAVSYPAGTYSIHIPTHMQGHILIVGAICGGMDYPAGRDAGLESGIGYASFPIEGFTDEPALFSIIGGEDNPVIDDGMPGTETIQGGFEGGTCIKLNGVYHIFPTERAGEAEMPAIYDRIKTRIGHWTSRDAIHWTRQSTLFQSSGKYAVSHEDNPANDRRAAIWSYMPVFSEEADRWYGHYLAYTCDEEIYPNHSFGRIWRCESVEKGLDGIGGPYKDCGIVLEPGLDSQLWEGRQGVASFFPYRVKDKWLSFFSGAFPFETKADYPLNGKKGAWYVGLAEADKLEGPWKRMDEKVNPIASIHPKFVENPIVSQLPDKTYIAVFDGGPATHKLPNMIAYTLSKDGYNWSAARYLPIDTKVKKWWHTMRTPLCLIPEGGDVYTILYAAIADKRFHPIGLVRVKLNRAVLKNR